MSGDLVVMISICTATFGFHSVQRYTVTVTQKAIHTIHATHATNKQSIWENFKDKSDSGFDAPMLKLIFHYFHMTERRQWLLASHVPRRPCLGSPENCFRFCFQAKLLMAADRRGHYSHGFNRFAVIPHLISISITKYPDHIKC